MNARRRTILQVVTPIVAIATMMIGLRIGARPKVTAAVVVGAAPGRTMSDGRTVLAWQVRAIVEDRGVREAVPGRRIVVTARANGQEAHGQGRTDEDGVVEVSLPFDRVAFGDTVAVDVIDDETKATLAHGDARWDPSAETHGTNTPRGSFLRPTKVSGDLELAVAVEGERLVPGFPVSVWIRAAARAARDRSDAAIVHVEPEPGVSFNRDLVTSCENGWAEFHATAHAHVTGATFTANSVQHASTSGTWFGALPVAPGAFFIDVPRVVPRTDPGNDATAVSIVAPNPRRTVYVEIDDD